MVQEVRKIMFSSDELLCAFEAYSRKKPDFLPAGRILAVTPHMHDDEVTVKMESGIGGASKPLELIYRDVDVLQPLILFCLENNIMLPRDGRKNFAVVEGRATLTVELNTEFDLVFEEAPMTTELLSKIKPDGLVGSTIV